MKAHITDLHCQREENAKTNNENEPKIFKKENAMKPLCAKLLFVTTDISDVFLVCYY